MKKILALIIVLAVCAAAGVYAYFIIEANKLKVASLESIVTDDALTYTYAYNLDKKIKEFQASELFKQFASLPVYAQQIAPRLEEINNKIPFISKLLQQDAALATFSLANPAYTQRNKIPLGDFMLIFRIDPKESSQIKKEIQAFYAALPAASKAILTKYQGVRITKYELTADSGLTLNYAFLGDVIVFSNKELLIQNSIDLLKKKGGNNLAASVSYQKITAKINKRALVWGYKNDKRYFQETMKALSNGALAAGSPGASRISGSFLSAKPFTSLMNIMDASSYYIDYDLLRDGIVEKVYYGFNKAQDKDNILNVITFNKEFDKKVFSLVPKSSIAFFGTSCDLASSWQFLKNIISAFDEQTKERMKSDPRYARNRGRMEKMSFKNSLAGMESFLGLSIDKDILPVLGNNLGLALVDIKDKNIMVQPPVRPGAPAASSPQQITILFPDVYAFLEVKDAAKAQKIMDQIFQKIVDNTNEQILQRQQKMLAYQQKLQAEAVASGKQPVTQAAPAVAAEPKLLKIDTETVETFSMCSIALPDDAYSFIKPNYALVDKYLLFSLSPELTKRAINIYKNNKDAFDSNFEFEALKKKIPENYSNILFFDFAKMIDTLNGTMSFRNLKNSFGAAKGPANEFDAVLALLSNIRIISFANKVIDGDTVETSFYFKIKGL